MNKVFFGCLIKLVIISSFNVNAQTPPPLNQAPAVPAVPAVPPVQMQAARASDPTVSDNINNFKSRVNASVSSASFQLENAKKPDFLKSSSNRYNFCVSLRLAIHSLELYSALKPGVDSFLVNTLSEKLVQSGLSQEQVKAMSIDSLISRFQGVLTMVHGSNCSM